jgi:hypothetical protein
VRVLAVGERTLLETIEKRFTPICRFDKAHSIRQANMRMGMASTPFDAFIVQLELPDGDGLDWYRELREGGEAARSMIVSGPGVVDLEARSAAAGACFLERDGSDWLGGLLRCFLERVATEHILTQLIRRYADERAFSSVETELLESALWMKCEDVSLLTGEEDVVVDERVDAICGKTGLPSVESAIVAALVRGILESLSGSGFDD